MGSYNGVSSVFFWYVALRFVVNTVNIKTRYWTFLAKYKMYTTSETCSTKNISNFRDDSPMPMTRNVAEIMETAI